MAGINFNIDLFDLPARRKQQQAIDQLEKLRQAAFGTQEAGPPTRFGEVPVAGGQLAPNPFVEQLLQPSTGAEGIKQTLALLEQQRKAEQAQRDLTQQQQVLGGITQQQPGLANLSALSELPAFQKEAISAITKAVAPAEEQKPTTLQQNLAAFGVDLKTPEGQKIGLDILSKPAVQINQTPDLPANFMWDDPINKTGVRPIPGGPADPEVKSFQDRTKKLRESNLKIGQVEQSVDNYSKLLDKHGVTITPGAAKTELKTAYTDLLLEMKELYNLGVLNGPDLELMQSLLVDPTSVKGKSLETVSGKEALTSQLNVVTKKIKSARERANLIYGGGPNKPIPTTPLPIPGSRPPLSSFVRQ